MAVQVLYKPLYNSRPSSAKQQLAMTEFLRGPENANDYQYWFEIDIVATYRGSLSLLLKQSRVRYFVDAISFYLHTHNYTPIVCIFFLLSNYRVPENGKLNLGLSRFKPCNFFISPFIASSSRGWGLVALYACEVSHPEMDCFCALLLVYPKKDRSQIRKSSKGTVNNNNSALKSLSSRRNWSLSLLYSNNIVYDTWPMLYLSFSHNYTPIVCIFVFMIASAEGFENLRPSSSITNLNMVSWYSGLLRLPCSKPSYYTLSIAYRSLGSRHSIISSTLNVAEALKSGGITL